MTATVDDLRETYGHWLESLPWDTFGTWTFRHGRGVGAASRAFTGWLDGLSEQGVDCSVVFWGCEPHPGGHGGHVHSLMRWHPWCEARVEAIASSILWRKRFGRCRLEPFRPGAGAAYYLTKYVLKESRNSGTYGVWTDGKRGVKDGEGVARKLGLSSRRGGNVDSGGLALGERSVPHSMGWRSQQETEEALDQEEEEVSWWQEVIGEEEEDRQERQVH